MAKKDSRQKKVLSEEKKRKIAREMVKGYKKMADINRELAEEGLRSHDETD
ncbi:hypothetical protein GM661_15415 [Iocasia frigidifontis]|uniref:Uncharacterized protein n=1 Tax=Iocasia fonsfrigidae TaxID=2682810 RepID=A0A8A7KGN5_9FIRM|nr:MULTISPECIES: hypothetical protein [Halanaerobiaceae]QTL99245.1 hypothetical protein GM661_15415 [Iocasia fonsfrigidae]